ncbi:MAG: ATP-binding protein, partial [Terriglobales bacterium]
VLRELTSKVPNLEELREAVAEVVEDATRVSSVISRLRALFKKETSDRVKLDINAVIQEVTFLVRTEAGGNDVQIRLDLAADLPPVTGDRVQLQQVLINLAVNGIDAMRSVTERPRILDIRSTGHGDGVLIQVHDSGRGLDPDGIDHIFQPFFTTKPQGIGLGLSISRSIIESHGGRLWAEPGSQGALFQFTLAAGESGSV